MATHPLVHAALLAEPAARVGALERFCGTASEQQLIEATLELHAVAFDVKVGPLQRARALFYNYAIHRFFLIRNDESEKLGHVPFAASELMLEGRFQEATDVLQATASARGMSDHLASALASAYHGLGFQVLAAHVQRSVRALKGNRWMFRTSHPLEHPLRMRRELLERDADGSYALLIERTPVRMDLSHSGWSDIFVLAMEYPEGAHVLNASVDLAIYGRDAAPAPPITCFLRVIDEPVLRLCSVDLASVADLSESSEVFDYARDCLGLLKAAIVASGIVPVGLEGSNEPLAPLLERLVGSGRGLELVSQVNDIPRGSRLAVSTNLLAGLISICMRATGQVAALAGGLSESERRVVTGRAILGEWLAGSGGGWQDSAGLWPGVKLIEGVASKSDDIEYGISRGCFLPCHTLLGTDRMPESALQALQHSLVVVHGGMSANVGPILELVTESFELGLSSDWQARQELSSLFTRLVSALCRGDIREVGRTTTRLFEGPLQSIVPWITNVYTENLIRGARAAFGERFWGFWMMGGMSGGGMGFIFDPSAKPEAEAFMLQLMQREKLALAGSLPFAMDPVVYRIALNEVGSTAVLRDSGDRLLSPEYYLVMLPRWLHEGSRSFSPQRRRELDAFATHEAGGARGERFAQKLLRSVLPRTGSERDDSNELDELLARHGFDDANHQKIRSDLQAGRIGLAQNRLPADARVEDVDRRDVFMAQDLCASATHKGEEAIARGTVAIVTLAAGAGSRWNQAGGTAKAICPFARMQGAFRSFLDIHLAKTRRAWRQFGRLPPHIFTTGYLTHDAIRTRLERCNDLADGLQLSRGRSIGLRFVPTIADLEFAWRQQREQKLESRKQKMRDSWRKALFDWALRSGEASDYRDNAPLQCVHPVGHWYEVANLLLNGKLCELLKRHPQLEHLMLHNVDTLGASLDPRWLGHHIESGATLSFEVLPRRVGDRGGGLAKIGGRVRLVEGLALPRAEDELKLSYYNSLTTWIAIDPLLALFGLTRATLGDEHGVLNGVRSLAARVPTYITLKDVKRRWGNAHEDVVTVAQFERLWGDMSALPELPLNFYAVTRQRGQQLKDVAQLDGMARDGSLDYVSKLCDFS
jgi:hypothetical protein